MASEEIREPKVPRQRPGIRSGACAFLAALILIAWVVLLVYLTSTAMTSELAGAVVAVMFIVSWVLVPILVIAILAFAVVALLLNPVPGKILGVLGILAPIIAGFALWNWLDISHFIATL